jgi:hypothetical protein
MKLFIGTLVVPILGFCIFPAILVIAGKPINIQVTLRGKKYSVPNVSTVSQLQATVENLTGLVSEKQSLLFNGKKLKSDDEHNDDLEEYGIEDGSVINVVPLSSKVGKKKSPSVQSTSSTAAEVSSKGQVSSNGSAGFNVDNLMSQAGVDTSQLQDLMKGFGGMDNGKLPDFKESMNMMKDLMNNPILQEMLTDPERLEQSRQMILSNPMMKSMFMGMPGFEELLNDKEKWRDSMIAAVSMYKDLSPEVMENMMSGLQSGLDGSLNELGDTAQADEDTNAALDELSEDDD